MSNGMRFPARLVMIAGLSMLAAAANAQTPAAPPPLMVMPLTGGVYWTSGGAGANTGFIVGTDGVIVIDAKMTSGSAKEMLAEIAKVTSKPVTTVILTHSDPDHVNGLAGFPKGLTIIAEDNAKKEMEKSESARNVSARAPADYLPTQTVSKDENLTIDGVHLRLLYFGAAHTSGDLIVYLPDQKIVFTGDILALQVPYPIIHLEKHGSSDGWITNMHGILALNADTFVPGHGDVQTSKAALQKRLADAEARRAQIKSMVAQGKSLDDIKVALNERDAAPGMGFQLPTFTEVIYQETTSNLPFSSRDLTGIWWEHQQSQFSLSENAPPMTPWAQAKYDAAKPGLGPRGKPLGNDPIMECNPVGYPRILFWNAYPIQFVQTPKEIFMFFDFFNAYRTIWTDGRKLNPDSDPRFYGNSVGHWEGDTLVVESNNFDSRAWLDADAHPISPEMTLEERFHRVDHNTIELTITLTDPKAYTKVWVGEPKTLTLADPKTEMREDLCAPADEAQYKDLVREPAGTGNAPK
jgi:cyclase